MSEPTEYHCYLAAVEGLRNASQALRSLALKRGDGRWLLPVRVLDEVADRIARLKDKGGAPLLWLPARND